MPRMRLGHAVGVELLEGVELLAGRREGDRPADDLLDRQRRAAAGVAVELGQDHAVELERLVERLGRGDRVLAGHGVDDEERVVGSIALGDLPDLVHHLVVDGQAAGGVDDDDVAPEAPGLVDAAGPAVVDRVAAARRTPARRSGGRACAAARRRRGAGGRRRRAAGCGPAP